MTKIALFIEGVGPGADALGYDQPVGTWGMAVHLDRCDMAMLEQLQQIFRGCHLLALLFPERPYVIPLMLNQFFEIPFSYCCKTRLHCRHTFRYTTWYTAPWP